MENLILFLATSLVFRLSSSKRLKNQLIGNTGCSALLAADTELECSPTQSGDRLFVHEFKESNVTYGMICVEMNSDHSLEEAETMLRSYIDQLRGPFYILHNTGILEESDWNTEASRTIADYWQDSHKKDWKVKGYTNGKVLAVLYVKNIGNVDVRKQDLFLDSFHFDAVQVK